MSLSKLYGGCCKCPYKGTCKNKRMEALATSSAPLTSDAAAPLIQKHAYRDIKVAKGTTITIDLEELKENMMQDHFQVFRGAT